jgi:hypothetical protein
MSKIPEVEIAKLATRRIARLFGLDEATISPSAAFGEGLEPSFVSDFKYNEFDQVDFDIRDLADRDLLKMLESGKLTIRTVSDYCQYMITCYRTNPDEVMRVLHADFQCDVKRK